MHTLTETTATILYSYAGQGFQKLCSKPTPLPEIPEDKDRLEEFCLVVALAAAKRMPGCKPAILNGRVIWHRETGQGITRTLANYVGTSIAEHSQVLYYWPYTLRKAIEIHIIKDLEEGLYDILKIKLKFMKEALDQLNFLKNHTYASLNDGTIDKLNICILIIQNLFNSPEIVKFYTILDSVPSVQNIQEEEILNEVKESNEIKKVREENNVENSSVQQNKIFSESTLSKEKKTTDRLRKQWRNIHLLKTLEGEFKDIDKIPVSKREGDPIFETSMNSTDGLLAKRTAKFQTILNKRKEYVD